MARKRLATKRMNAEIKGRLRTGLLQGRRDTLFKMLTKRHGVCPCFVCMEPVAYDDASVEHIVPSSKGGTDDMSNLTISHEQCNIDRGSA